MFELLNNIVEEIGEENVVQIVTDGASNLVDARKSLIEKRTKLFWSPCAAHCLDIILEDIGELPIVQIVSRLVSYIMKQWTGQKSKLLKI